MTIRIRKTLLDRLLNKFGYHRHAKLPDGYEQVREKFGPYVHIKTTGDLDIADNDILTDLSNLADKLVAIASGIKGLEVLNDNDRQAAEYGLVKMVIDLSNDVSHIHADIEQQDW